MRLNQETIVLALTALLGGVFALTLPRFLTAENGLSLLRSVSVLGILGVGMAVVIIGRGIDLAIVAIMAVSVAWTLTLAAGGTPLAAAVALGLGFALLAGLATGILTAFLDVPAIFASLAMGAAVAGFGQFRLFDLGEVYVTPASRPLAGLGAGTVLGLPAPVLAFAAVALAALGFLRATKIGRSLYAVGDNPAAARITGLPVRTLLALRFVISAALAYLAGLITAGAVSSMNTRVVDSTLIYDVILVAVIGGVGLSGGKGGVRNVVAGTLLIGVLVNGMTIMDLQYTTQNIVKSLVLLSAIIVDSIINPRDEQTAQQGDI